MSASGSAWKTRGKRARKHNVSGTVAEEVDDVDFDAAGSFGSGARSPETRGRGRAKGKHVHFASQ